MPRPWLGSCELGGQIFRGLTARPQCNWETDDDAPKINTSAIAAESLAESAPGSSASSIKSAKLAVPAGLGSGNSRGASTVSVQQMVTNPTKPVRVSYLTEQTSHHPPVSAFYISCPEKGLYARGYDQITAKFTGTSIKVMPGEHNLGIFITLDKRDNETYQLKHPAAHLGGILRGALSVSVGDVAYVTCPQTGLKAILQYFDEGWLGRSTNKVEGVIFRYDPENDDKTKIRDVPEADILVRLAGPWKEKIAFTLGPQPVVSRSKRGSPSLQVSHGFCYSHEAGLASARGTDHHHRPRSSQRGSQSSPSRGAAARQ